MKYAKRLDEILCQYPWYIRIRCISYRKWKKSVPENWKFWLLFDFLKSPSSLLSVNLETLYKICKRLAKRFGLESLEFYRRVSKTISKEANETLLELRGGTPRV